ncbi:hypothetical protein PCASD_16502 [Puccinia coronata f. sp. avenae]|uniref:Uncharacterized protein n=1 Tax=Puccinia coronata f. sp. avenae TaxID=200324 RepID=A0A2N5SVH9_9BASI|nr:hypothetical protein PCASD_16502 [Puccinia coronata f. sp. avenae]
MLGQGGCAAPLPSGYASAPPYPQPPGPSTPLGAAAPSPSSPPHTFVPREPNSSTTQTPLNQQHGRDTLPSETQAVPGTDC